MRGTKKRPVAGLTIDGFFQSLTHLNLNGLRLTGDVAAIVACKNLRVLYVYDNRLTSLRGLGGLERLTHLYAQDNRIVSLHDFEAPAGLQQLHLGGNCLSLIGGLETCTCLTELHIGGQKPPADVNAAIIPAAPSGGEVKGDEESGAASPASAASGSQEPVASAPALAIEPQSLIAISQTLRKLVAAHDHISDDDLEPVVMLQSLTSLDVRGNALESIGRLQQILLRLPCLTSLGIRDNPLVTAPKLRERLIVASHTLADIDGRAVKPNERAFLEQLAQRQGSAGAGRAGDSKEGSSRTASANRGRPQQLGVSIPSDKSYDLGRTAGLLLGEPPAGFYDDEHRPVSFALQKGTSRPWGRAPHAA